MGPSAATQRAAGWLAASGVAANVVVGRGPFVLGVGFGALALLAAGRGRTAGAIAAAGATVAASPVAGLFLALILAARALGGPGRPALREATALLAVLAVGAAMVLPFPEGGRERFVATAFWPILALTLASAALLARTTRTLALSAAGYAVLLIAAFLVATPVGQNATRLATLAGPPLLLLAGRGPRLAVLVTAAALTYLAWLPAVRAIAESRGDPATAAAYHAPLLAFLDANAAPGDRVEIPLTRNHWEAVHVAKRYAIARGWERQLDLKYNGLFYADQPLTPDAYEAWLDREQIRWVALPRSAPPDFSARREVEILRSRPPFLEAPTATGDWLVFENRSVAPAPITATTPSSITTRRAGTLPRRFTRYWRVTAGRGCVQRGPGDRIAVTSRGPAPVRIEARVSGPTCR